MKNPTLKKTKTALSDDLRERKKRHLALNRLMGRMDIATGLFHAREEGLEEGRAEGRREVIEEILNSRFSSDVVAVVMGDFCGLSSEILSQFLKCIWEFQTVEEIQEWIARRRGTSCC